MSGLWLKTQVQILSTARFSPGGIFGWPMKCLRHGPDRPPVQCLSGGLENRAATRGTRGRRSLPSCYILDAFRFPGGAERRAERRAELAAGDDGFQRQCRSSSMKRILQPCLSLGSRSICAIDALLKTRSLRPGRTDGRSITTVHSWWLNTSVWKQWCMTGDVIRGQAGVICVSEREPESLQSWQAVFRKSFALGNVFLYFCGRGDLFKQPV